MLHTDNTATTKTDKRKTWGIGFCERVGDYCPRLNEPRQARGAKGGNACKAKHGPEFYRDLANKRWGKAGQ
jgi:hypothetical protein